MPRYWAVEIALVIETSSVGTIKGLAFDDHGSDRSCGETVLVGRDVVDRVSCNFACVDLRRARFNSVRVCRNAEAEVRLWAGDGSGRVADGRIKIC